MNNDSHSGSRLGAWLLVLTLSACATVDRVPFPRALLQDPPKRGQAPETPVGEPAPPASPQGEHPEQQAEQTQEGETPEEPEVLEERRRGVEGEPEEEVPAAQKPTFSWRAGPRWHLLGGDLVLILGTRLHVDVATVLQPEEMKNSFGLAENGFEVRRAFVELGAVYKQLEAAFWVDFSNALHSLREDDEDSGDNVDYRNVFVGLNELPVVGGIRAGYFKEPFGLEEITSSNDITFMERSLTGTFTEGRNLGVMLQRRVTGDRRMTLAVGGFRDADNDLSTEDGYGITARVTGAPILSDDGRQVLHIGLSGTYRWPPDDAVQFKSRPESAQAPYLADTGSFGASRDIRYGAELGAVLGSLSLQSEYIGAATHGSAGYGNAVFHSVYAMVSYVLTGEHRTYRQRVGAFGTVEPANPFTITHAGIGAWEVAMRYSYLDLDSGGIDGGVLHDYTAAVNWYLNGNARMMFDYVLAHPEGFGYDNIFQMRLQLSF